MLSPIRKFTGLVTMISRSFSSSTLNNFSVPKQLGINSHGILECSCASQIIVCILRRVKFVIARLL